MPDPDQQTRLLFDAWLPAGQETFTTKEVAGIFDLDPQTVRNAAEAGELLGHKIKGRGRRDYQTWRFPRLHVVLWLAKTGNYAAEEFYYELERTLFSRLPLPRLRELGVRIEQQTQQKKTRW